MRTRWLWPLVIPVFYVHRWVVDQKFLWALGNPQVGRPSWIGKLVVCVVYGPRAVARLWGEVYREERAKRHG